MIIVFQPPCGVQVHQPPDQAAQSHIQRGLECLQGWGILRQPVPVCHHVDGLRAGPAQFRDYWMEGFFCKICASGKEKQGTPHKKE